MGAIEDLVTQLIDAGTPPALAAAIVARAYVEGANSTKAEPARTARQERNARHYAKRKAAEQDAIQTDKTVSDAIQTGEAEPITPPPFSPPIKNSPTPPKKLTPLYPPNPEPSLRSVSPSPSRLGEIFDGEFWPVCPRRTGKDAARKAFDRAAKRADPAVIVAGMRRYAAERQGEDPQFTKHPATWLNAGCWADDPEPARRRPVSSGDYAAGIIRGEISIFDDPHERATHDQPIAYDLDLTRAAAPAAGVARLSRVLPERSRMDERPTLDLGAEDPDRRRA